MRKKRKKTKKPLVIVLFITLVIVGIVIYLKSSGEDTSDIPVVSLNSTTENTKVTEKDYKFIQFDDKSLHEGSLILVNNDIKYVDVGNNQLTSVYEYKSKSYKVSNKNVSVNYGIIKYLNSMLDDFYDYSKKDDVLVCSGYRSVTEQKTIYDNRDNAKGWVATPEYSEHHTGYAIDFSLFSNFGINTDYTGKGKYAWIEKNAYKYGFILRYPETKTSITGINDEPWHFRYVGAPHAYIIKEKDFCLEEYINYLKDYEYKKKHLLVNDGSFSYEIYFIKAESGKTKVPVPKNYKYEVSGNNIDGYIVTIKKNAN